MRVLIADGGTGGHIFPAIAIADELKRRKEVDGVLFTGTPNGMEVEIVPRHGYELRLIHVGGLIGKSLSTRVKTLMRLPAAYAESRAILRDFHPRVVIGFGAYASGPVIVAAWRQRLPILLVEPNAIPGFTNRVASRMARKVAVGFEDRDHVFKGKAVVTGTPVRPLQLRAVENDRFTFGIFCGSQGSQFINRTIVDALPRLAERRDRLRLIHQTGKNDYERIRSEFEKTAPFFDAVPFISDVEAFYSRCDLLLCRAGAVTLAELTALGKPAILVPLPTATHNHQEQNARRLAEAGGARMILQKDLTVELLLNELDRLMGAPDQLEMMSQASRNLGKPDATQRVVDLALSLAS
jgi:UDP-N-acetylglucosamine--N-acetylmuramyl-(pentapeptide) pyrophosphoryl-undecaprenol N-acetylglucosamine transferase